MRQNLLALSVTLLLANVAHSETLDVWFGTGGGPAKGIYYAQLDTESGELTESTLAATIKSPGFLAANPRVGDVIYSTGNVNNEPSLAAHRIGRYRGRARLSLINAQPIGDGGAAHLDTDREGRALLSAQYGGGSTAIFPLRDDGSIGPRAQLIEHEGASGVVSARQEKPHPHWVGTSPDNRFAFVPDLGMDKVVVYQLDAQAASLKPNGFGQLPPGGGPRHMKFHTSGRFAFVLNELALSVTAFDYDPQGGKLTPIETVPTVPAEQKAKERFVSASEIRVHPSGNFLYAANRGHDTITAMSIDSQTGKLAVIEIEPVRGGWPRNFNIDPSGRWLLAAGRDSHTVTVFEIDSETGELTYTRNVIMVPAPICVLFGSS